MEREVARSADADAAVRARYTDYRAMPVVITGAARDWPILRDPSAVLPSLRRHAGAAIVSALRLYYDDAGVQCAHSTEDVSVSELLDRADESAPREFCYLQWRDLPFPPGGSSSIAQNDAPLGSSSIAQNDAPPGSSAASQHDAPPGSSAATQHDARALMRAVRRPGCIGAAALRQANAWIGRSRTSHLHFDGMDNVLVVAHGAKEVVLFSPFEELAAMYPDGTERWKSRARSTLYDLSDYPRLRTVPRLRATIRAGEALYIPAGWWHEVLTPTLTVAFNFCT